MVVGDILESPFNILGSNPPSRPYWLVAQLVESLTVNQVVTGPSPV